MGQKALIGTVLCGLGATLLLPGVAAAQQDRVSGTEKGSLCIFSKVEIKWAGDGILLNLVQDTFISFTNDYPEDVLVQMYFINGDPPLEQVGNVPTDPDFERSHMGWNSVNNGITLTMNEPAYWSALTGLPKGTSPFTVLDPGTTLDNGTGQGRPCPECGPNIRCLRGYIIAWAVNSENNQIRWNHLKGEGTLINYRDGYAWEYNSWNHQVNAGTSMNNGDQVSDLWPPAVDGVLNLNGDEYSVSFDELLLNFQAAGSAAFSSPPPNAPLFPVLSDTDLTLHPVAADLRQNDDGPVTTKASMDIWNENETKFSGTHRCITCWDQTLISDYDTPNHFLRAFLQTDHGKARIDGHAADECDVPDDPNTPEDEEVMSIEAPILGVYARLLKIGMTGANDPFNAAAGSNLIGMGTDPTAVIQYDPSGPPPGAGEQPSTPQEILDWLEKETGVKKSKIGTK